MGRVTLSVLIGIAFLFALNRALMPLSPSRGAPHAADGVIDLRTWSFERDGMVQLAGDWNLVWERTLSPATVAKGADGAALVRVPGLWSDWKHVLPRNPASGFCTMWLRVLLPAESPKLRVHFPPMSGAYTFYANGEPIQQTGKFSEAQHSEVPAVKQASALLPLTTTTPGEVLLVLHHSNFQLARGGLPRALVLGTDGAVRRLLDRRRLMVVFMLGGAFMIGAYHLVLLAIRREERSLAYFGLLNFALAVHLLFASDLVPLNVPGFPSRWQLRLEFLSLYLAVPLIILHLNEIYPANGTRRVAVISGGLASLGVLIALINPALAQAPSAQWTFLGLALMTLAPSFANLIGLVRRGQSHPFWLLVCGTAFCGGLIHDALYSEYLVSGPPLWGYGFLVFSLAEAGFMGVRMNRSFLQQQDLSQRLLTLNSELESRVQQRTAELVESHRQKDRLLSLVAHDMRTPLHGIIKLTEMMRRRPALFSAEEVERLTAELQAGARSLLRLVSNLFDWGRLETGVMPCHRCWHALPPLLDSSVAPFRPVAEAKGIVLRVHIDSPLEVQTDADLLRIVLSNLVSNALKFSDPGDRVAIVAVPGAREASVELQVIDTGSGLDPETIARITRAEKIESRIGTDGESGHGFGLMICRRCLALLDASLDVQSEPGVRTCFSIVVPARPISDAAVTSSPSTLELKT